MKSRRSVRAVDVLLSVMVHWQVDGRMGGWVVGWIGGWVDRVSGGRVALRAGAWAGTLLGGEPRSTAAQMLNVGGGARPRLSRPVQSQTRPSCRGARGATWGARRPLGSARRRGGRVRRGRGRALAWRDLPTWGELASVCGGSTAPSEARSAPGQGGARLPAVCPEPPVLQQFCAGLLLAVQDETGMGYMRFARSQGHRFSCGCWRGPRPGGAWKQACPGRA